MEEVVKRAEGQCSEEKSLSFPLCSLVVWRTVGILENDVPKRLCLSSALFPRFVERKWSSQTSARKKLRSESRESCTGSVV